MYYGDVIGQSSSSSLPLVYCLMQQTAFQTRLKIVTVNCQIIYSAENMISFVLVLNILKRRSNQGMTSQLRCTLWTSRLHGLTAEVVEKVTDRYRWSLRLWIKEIVCLFIILR